MTGWGGDDGADGFSTGVARRPERERLEKEEYRRKPKPLAEFLEEGGLLETEANARLRAEGHSEVILEELLAGRLYTGPMCKQISSSHPDTSGRVRE